MLKTVIGLFDSRDQAERAVSALRNSGFHEEISIVAADKSQATGQQKSGEMVVNEGSISSGVSTGVFWAAWPVWRQAQAHWPSRG